MELLARTRITMWEGASLWIVDALPTTMRTQRRTDMHAHHAIQVTLSLGGSFRLDTAAGHLSDVAGAVAPDSSHCFEAEGLIALLFIEPESRAGRAIGQALFQDVDLATVSPEVVQDFRCAVAGALSESDQDDRIIAEIGRDLVKRLAGNGPAAVHDARVRRMIAHAADHIEGPVALADLVPVCGISSSRLSHLFVEQTGLAFRTYVLWLRLTQAVRAIADGANLTEAAHQAGFADSPHFSRTFRRMFGVAPANLQIS